MPKLKRRHMDYWPISNTRARKLRQKGVPVFAVSDRRLGYKGMGRHNPLRPTQTTRRGG
ncbi:MAG: hypothetical protein AWU57_460 [Marinobacter sp. T13-3]|nr:MAG: hypothetical protein AWU57_460 [Marinobacter sp. T13-3]